MNSLRLAAPRFATALFAVIVLVWCAAQAIDFDGALPPAPANSRTLLLGGVTAAPLALPLLTLLLDSARE